MRRVCWFNSTSLSWLFMQLETLNSSSRAWGYGEEGPGTACPCPCFSLSRESLRSELVPINSGLFGLLQGSGSGLHCCDFEQSPKRVKSFGEKVKSRVKIYWIPFEFIQRFFKTHRLGGLLDRARTSPHCAPRKHRACTGLITLSPCRGFLLRVGA